MKPLECIFIFDYINSIDLDIWYFGSMFLNTRKEMTVSA